MEEHIDAKIDKVIDLVQTSQSYNGSDRPEYKGISRDDLRTAIKKILGLTQQCHICLQYKFDHDLTAVEGFDWLVCQNCVERIMDGEVDLSKYQ